MWFYLISRTLKWSRGTNQLQDTSQVVNMETGLTIRIAVTSNSLGTNLFRIALCNSLYLPSHYRKIKTRRLPGVIRGYQQMKTVELRFTIPGMYLATPNYLLSALSPQLFPYICYFFITGKWIKLFIDILNIKVVFWFIPYCSD